MNYIQQLQKERDNYQAYKLLVETRLAKFSTFLVSPKFTGLESGARKDWIATGDVLRWISAFKQELGVLND